MPEKIIDVAVGVLLRPDGTVLLGNRPADKPWPGWWELPGGKLEPGESVMRALARELHEELGIQLHTATPWVTYMHAYPTTTVRLAFCRVTGWDGEPQGLEGQLLRWVPLSDATLDNGCPWVVPGLHHMGTLHHDYAPLGLECFKDPENPVAVPAKVGDVVVFSSLTPHRTGPNMTGETRKSYILQYAPDGAMIHTHDGNIVPANDPERQFRVAPT